MTIWRIHLKNGAKSESWVNAPQSKKPTVEFETNTICLEFDNDKKIITSHWCAARKHEHSDQPRILQEQNHGEHDDIKKGIDIMARGDFVWAKTLDPQEPSSTDKRVCYVGEISHVTKNLSGCWITARLGKLHKVYPDDVGPNSDKFFDAFNKEFYASDHESWPILRIGFEHEVHHRMCLIWDNVLQRANAKHR